MKIIFIDTVHPILQEMLESAGHTCVENYSLTKEELMQEIPNYEGVVLRSKFVLDKSILEKASKLKFIARSGSGLENIDVEFAKSKGIEVINSPEGNRDAVGEHALAMLLCLFNNLIRGDKEVREGKWNRAKNRGVEIKGKTIGIIGYGMMGTTFVQRLRGFDCNILAFDKYKKGFGNEWVKESTLEDLFEKADVLSLHIPLTEETNFMVDETFLNKFKKNIYLINTSRGKNVRTKDLIKLLKSGKVLGACLDVLEFEKHSFEDLKEIPETFKELCSLANVILSPHVAGWTMESYVKLSSVLGDKIQKKFG